MMRKRLFCALAILALGGCGWMEQDIYDRYGAYLSGGSIAVGQKGHLYGSGLVDFWAPEPPLVFCYDISANKIEGVTAAHVHRGPLNSVGLEVMTLKPPVDGRSRGCFDVTRQFLADLKANPEAFYVDIHSTEFPLGAVRGQVQHQSPDVRRPRSSASYR